MLEFKHEWLPVEGVHGDELRVTWARLEILVNGATVSRVFDPVAKTIRDSLHVPLYPLAEWFASNWFFLLHEVEAPERSYYANRHNLLTAAQGYAYPDLAFCSGGGDMIPAVWRPNRLAAQGLRFLEEGRDWLDRASFEIEVARFLETVVARLDSEGLTGLPLQDEWTAIRSLGEEEREFCAAAAKLSYDPFDMPQGTEQWLVGLNDILPKSLLDDFLVAVVPEHAEPSLEWVRSGLEQDAKQVWPTALEELRKGFPGPESDARPWVAGYDAANWVRASAGWNGHPLTGQRFEYDFGFSGALNKRLPGCPFDALISSDESGTRGAVRLSGTRPDSRRFAYARALYEHLSGRGQSALVTRAQTLRQAESRAFAAELLAPAEGIRSRLGDASSVGHQGRWVSQDEIGELAEEYQVSSMVIANQIENHGIANVLPT